MFWACWAWSSLPMARAMFQPDGLGAACATLRGTRDIDASSAEAAAIVTSRCIGRMEHLPIRTRRACRLRSS
jgi:hypothetical protein